MGQSILEWKKENVLSLSKRVKKMENKQHDTRHQILEVASSLFMNHGFLATSTRKIATEVGITQPNLYHHFRNKEEIYVAVMENLAAEVKDYLDEMVASTKYTFVEQLEQMILFLQEKHPADFNIMMHDMDNHLSPESRAKLFIIWKNSYQQPFISLFETKKAHLRANLSPELAARHFFLTLAPYIRKEPVPGGLTIEQMIDFFIYGIVKDAP